MVSEVPAQHSAPAGHVQRARGLPEPLRVAPALPTEQEKREHNDQHGLYHDPHLPPTSVRHGASPHRTLEAPFLACSPARRSAPGATWPPWL